MRIFGIYSFRDYYGKVDNYILKILNDLYHKVEYVLFITDRPLMENEKNKILNSVDEVLILDYSKTHCFNYASAVLYCVQSGKFEGIDQVLFLNDEIYGPFITFEEIFTFFTNKEYDFAGLYCQPSWRNSQKTISKDYFPSYFWLFKKEILTKGLLFKSIKRLVKYKESQETQNLVYEQITLQIIRSMQLAITSYLDINEWISAGPEKNFGILQYKCKELIIDKGLPFLPRESFRTRLEYDNSLNETLNYISEFGKYDKDYILENVIRTCNAAEIKDNLNLNFIISGQNYIAKTDMSRENVLIIAHIYYEECVEECLKYLQNVPLEFDMIITYSKNLVYQKLKLKTDEWGKKNLSYRKVENRGRDAAALFVGCSDTLLKYEYLCFVHDKKTSGESGPAVFGDWFRYEIWENCLKSRDYIYKVLELFKKDKRLGFLSPPFPKFFNYVHLFGKEWTLCYNITKQLAERLGIDSRLIDREMPPFAFSNTFWCRAEVLKPMFDYGFAYEDFPEEPLLIDGTINHGIERIYAYASQKMGYYAGIIESDEYASVELLNMLKLLGNQNVERDTLFAHIQNQEKEIANLKQQSIELKEKNKNFIDNSIRNLYSFCSGHKRIFIYGAGKKAKRIAALIMSKELKFDSFVVSDGMNKPENLIEHQVCYISDIDLNKEDGLVIALNQENTCAILPVIEKYAKNISIFHAD